jgi:hypothetical protein
MEGWDFVEWIDLAESKDKWRARVSYVHIPQNAAELFTASAVAGLCHLQA